MLVNKCIYKPCGSTAIALEPIYWEAIERMAGGNVSQWVRQQLTTKPSTEGNASWVRQQVLHEVLQK